MISSSQAAFPSCSADELTSTFVGRSLHDVPLPSAVLDMSTIKHSCKLMLAAVDELGVKFRAHVKTHKTSQLTELQLGKDCQDARVIVSTVAEAEALVPLLQTFQGRGANVNLLYGVPLGVSHVERLAQFLIILGPGSLSLMVDNPEQLGSVKKIHALTGGSPACVFLKTDSGYHRAGLRPSSDKMKSLVTETCRLESEGKLNFLGFYSHNSLSYNGSSPDDAMDMLRSEIEVCREAAGHLVHASPEQQRKKRVFSVGASPTALSIQNIQSSFSSHTTTTTAAPTSSQSSSAKQLKAAITDLLRPLPVTDTASSTGGSVKNSQEDGGAEGATFELEIHAGVYPVFDMQQVAACSRDSRIFTTSDPHDAIALSVLTEVCATYPDRTAQPEALTNAGCLALAREPCKDYRGWGVVSNWNVDVSASASARTEVDDEKKKKKTKTKSDDDDDDDEEEEAITDCYSKSHRMIVSRISQEHGVLGWEDATRRDVLPLTYGQRLRIWPNHACITGAMFDWYLVVDGGDEVVDVWVRWRGW